MLVGRQTVSSSFCVILLLKIVIYCIENLNLPFFSRCTPDKEGITVLFSSLLKTKTGRVMKARTFYLLPHFSWGLTLNPGSTEIRQGNGWVENMPGDLKACKLKKKERKVETLLSPHKAGYESWTQCPSSLLTHPHFSAVVAWFPNSNTHAKRRCSVNGSSHKWQCR